MAEAQQQEYRRNHYVPQWYQRRFLVPSDREAKLYYRDLKPDTFADGQGTKRTRKAVNFWGPIRCFRRDDLYTTRFPGGESTEIERRFFGPIDASGPAALDYWTTFQHPSADRRAFVTLLDTMSIQKLRTPKGLRELEQQTATTDRNTTLILIQRLRNIHCAIWTESIWSILDASDAEVKFILSDHPVTVYNSECFPGGSHCRRYGDPAIWLNGTHTIYPIHLSKVLVLSNLSWVRNPYGKADRARPNPFPFRTAVFNATRVQTGRKLSAGEVAKINYIIKRRADRYIAAAREEWLEPESMLASTNWRELSNDHFLMPDPRLCEFSREVVFGFDDKPGEVFDEYGRRPGQSAFRDQQRSEREWRSFHRFKGEYARLFGPSPRGAVWQPGDRSSDEVCRSLHSHNPEGELKALSELGLPAPGSHRKKKRSRR